MMAEMPSALIRKITHGNRLTACATILLDFIVCMSNYFSVWQSCDRLRHGINNYKYPEIHFICIGTMDTFIS
jgi:hypothetical protein